MPAAAGTSRRRVAVTSSGTGANRWAEVACHDTLSYTSLPVSIDAPESHASPGAAVVDGASSRWMVVAFGALVAAVVGWFVLGMPGMDHSTTGDGHASMPVEGLTASEFATRMADPDVFVVNVHEPYEGEIAGTDALIPYDRIAGDPRLPDDKDTKILLYCRTGRMSESAARALMGEGYTNVAHLAGGMQAWSAAGRDVLQRGS